MGKCWGLLVGAHSDLPERWTREVGLSMRTRGEEAVMMRDIDRRIRDEDAGRKHRKFGKKEKKDKDKKKEKKREKKAKEKVDQDRGKMYDSLPTEYFDFTSEHGLIPALPSNNSYNRNFVLSFGHSGVKFILARLLAQHDSRASLLRLRDKLIQKQESVRVNPTLLRDATRYGTIGLESNRLIYDDVKKEERDRPKPVTVRSTDVP